MTVALVIVARDAEGRIGKAALSARPLIDAWTLVDTGSADSTVEEIQDALHGIDGQVVRREWAGHADARTAALRAARGTADWLLQLDADMTVEAHPGLRAWLDTDPDPDVAAWQTEIRDGRVVWRLPMLVRGDRPWEYRGETHSYLVGAGKQRPLLGLTLHHHGGYSREKIERDAEILRPAAEAGDARSAYYLAQSLKGLGRIDEAIVWYDRRAAMTGTWEEERWHASYQAARLRGSVEDLLAVHAARPWRHEPLTAAAAIVYRRDPNANGDTLFRELFPTIPSVPKGDVEWDEWRANYDRWSFEEHRRFYRKVAGRYPIQRQWDGAAVRAFLADTLPRRVVEIGGWDGSLAAEMLREFDTIETWTNYEIADVPQACDDGRYRRVVLDDWPWLLDVEADALIASHVVEHMRVTEAEELLRRWDLGAAFIDTPVGKTARSWAGYRGSHIIEVGNGELVERLASTGYDPTVVEATDDRLVLHLRRQEPPSSV